MIQEAVIGIIPNARIKTGMFSSKMYTLVFTNYRLILAEATKDLVNARIEQARASAKAQGGGFFAQWGAQLKSGFRFGEHYLQMPPMAILAETPGNGALAPGEIRELKIERKTRNAGSDDDFEQVFLKITIESTGGKHVFETDGEQPGRDQARGMAASVFGPVVR
jgi:hypothetical protein